MRTAGRVALLVALWVLAWGELSLANVVTGIAAAAVVLLAFPPGHRRATLRLRPLGVARLVAYVVKQMLTSNLLMAREIVRRRPGVKPGVLAHELRHPSEEAVTLMTSIIALGPGTMTADVDPGSTTVYVHFFRLDDLDGARRMLERLDRLVTGAIGGGDG